MEISPALYTIRTTKTRKCKYADFVNAKIYTYIMFIGPCIFVIVEELKTNLMSQFIKFYFTSYVLNMFQTLIYSEIK